MQRRDVLRLIASTVSLSAIPGEMMLALQEARADTDSSFGIRTLNPHQDATVTAMSEVIIPETDTPGAKGAKVNEFIDLMLTEWFGETEKVRFLQDLAQVDADCCKRFGANFVACNPSQQAMQIKQLDDAAVQFARTHKATGRKEAPPPPTANFFYTFKRLTLVGYYTSEIGFKRELGKTVIPPKHSGCAPVSEVRS